MLKENLIKRLATLTDAIAQQDAQIHQICANRNVLQGSHSEVKMLIDEFDKMSEPNLMEIGKEMKIEDFEEKTA